MHAKATIRKFLFVNLLFTITLTTLLTTIGSYYVSSRLIHSHLDNLLIELGFIFKTSTPIEGLTPKALERMRVQIQRGLATTQDKYFLFKNKTFVRNKFSQHYQFQIWSRTGELLVSSALATQTPFIGTPGISDQYIEGHHWRVFTIPDEQQSFIFVVAENYEWRRSLIRQIILDDLYLVLFIYTPSALFTWLIVWRGLKKMRSLASHIAYRVADNLEPVDLNAVPIEITPLIDRLNKLFLRLKQAYEREQRFATDAAHELHTPLAALRTQAQVALKTVDQKERFSQLQNIIFSVDRCTHIIQQLLILCRLNPETVMTDYFSQINLSSIVSEVMVQLVPNAVDKQIEIELISDEAACILSGNTASLHALTRNLIDNAIRYTPKGGMIKVFVQNQPNFVMFRVVDNGLGIPKELHKRVFERFFRVLGTNVQGSGLGLSIVEQIVRLYRGKISLDSPEEGTGLVVTILLPRL